MKTKSIISKFKKAGITLQITDQYKRGCKVRGESKTQTIGFTDQDGEAVCFWTCKTKYMASDALRVDDYTSKNFHYSIKDALNWVLRQDLLAA